MLHKLQLNNSAYLQVLHRYQVCLHCVYLLGGVLHWMQIYLTCAYLPGDVYHRLLVFLNCVYLLENVLHSLKVFLHCHCTAFTCWGMCYAGCGHSVFALSLQLRLHAWECFTQVAGILPWQCRHCNCFYLLGDLSHRLQVFLHCHCKNFSSVTLPREIVYLYEKLIN